MNGRTRVHPPDPQALQARFALRVVSRLSEQTDLLAHDIVERLRVAREQAVARARQVRLAQPVAASAFQLAGVSRGGVALGQSPSGWLRLASLLPLMVLVLGLLLIQHLHEQAEIRAAADVDAALLADDLPPEAYGDPGFVAFLTQPEP
ncbi:MAG TPA: DUF3619 family protein [Rubrivivax sp.]|nr:DUF3619 family protein [Rubrivivax sp.]